MRVPRPMFPHPQIRRWALALALAWAPVALSNGGSLPGLDPVREPEPALTTALHARADAARAAAGVAPTAWDDGLARAARAFSVDDSGTVDGAGAWRPGSALRRWLEVSSTTAVPLADGAHVALALAEPLGDGRMLARHALVAERRGDAVALAAGR